MAWKPKTIVGKILKGVVIGGGAALALASGVGAIAGVAGGTGLIAGALTGAKVVGKVVSTVAKGAVKAGGAVARSATNIITGTTPDQRRLINEQKDETRAEAQKLEVVDKLIKAGATVSVAASKAGVPLSELAGMFGLPEGEAASIGENVAGKQEIIRDIELTSGVVDSAGMLPGQGCAGEAAVIALAFIIGGTGIVYTLISLL